MIGRFPRLDGGQVGLGLVKFTSNLKRGSWGVLACSFYILHVVMYMYSLLGVCFMIYPIPDAELSSGRLSVGIV